VDKDDDDKKEQSPFPSYQAVNKPGELMGQSCRGLHEDNTDGSSDYELLPIPSGCVKVRTNGR
jgi:hypothetical protein